MDEASVTRAPASPTRAIVADEAFCKQAAAVLLCDPQPIQDAFVGEPVEEVLAYVRRKLELSRDFPRESRLFANEVLRGAPHLTEVLGGELAALVDEKAAILGRWMDEGRLARLPPEHLVFSIWALTQHYADFDTQVRAVLGDGRDPFAEAGPFLDLLFRRLLAP